MEADVGKRGPIRNLQIRPDKYGRARWKKGEEMLELLVERVCVALTDGVESRHESKGHDGKVNVGCTGHLRPPWKKLKDEEHRNSLCVSDRPTSFLPSLTASSFLPLPSLIKMAFASAFIDEFCVLSSQFMYTCTELPFQEPVVATYEDSLESLSQCSDMSEDVESELSHEESHFYQTLLESPIVQQFGPEVDTESLTSEDFVTDEDSVYLQEALEAYIEYKMEEDYDW